MLHNRIAILAAVAGVAIVVGVMFAPVAADVSAGSKAPSFRLSTLDGKTVGLADVTDKPTVIVFWATWCPHCRAEMPVVEKIYKDVHAKGGNILGISLDDKASTASDFVRANHITFPIAVAGSRNDIVRSYGISGIPTVFVLDKGGVVKARYAGEVSESTIRGEFAKLGVK